MTRELQLTPAQREADGIGAERLLDVLRAVLSDSKSAWNVDRGQRKSSAPLQESSPILPRLLTVHSVQDNGLAMLRVSVLCSPCPCWRRFSGVLQRWERSFGPLPAWGEGRTQHIIYRYSDAVADPWGRRCACSSTPLLPGAPPASREGGVVVPDDQDDGGYSKVSEAPGPNWAAASQRQTRGLGDGQCTV